MIPMKLRRKRALSHKITGCIATVICLLSGFVPNADAEQTKTSTIRQKSNHHSKLGSHHVQRGDYTNAEIEYRKAIEIDPTNFVPYDGLGFIFALQKKFQEAEEKFDTALKINPDYVPTLYKLGKIFLIRQENDKAKDTYQKAVNVEPTYYPAHHGLGIIYSQEENLNKAVEHLQHAVSLNPKYGPSRYRLGSIYLQQQEYSKAIEELNKAASLVGNEPSIHYALGNTYMAIGKLSDAINSYNETLRLDPRRADVHDKLGLTYTEQSYALLGAKMADQDKLAMAVKEHRRAVELGVDNVKARFALAQELAQSEDDASLLEAQQLFEQILDRHPENLAVLVVHARLASARGDTAAAMDTVDRLRGLSGGWPSIAQDQFNALSTAVSTGELDRARTLATLLRKYCSVAGE